MKTFVHVVLMLLHCRWLLRRGAGFKFHAYCNADWFFSSKAPPWLVFTSSSRTAWTMTPSHLMDFTSPWEISSSPSCRGRNFGRQMSICRSSMLLLRKVWYFCAVSLRIHLVLLWPGNDMFCHIEFCLSATTCDFNCDCQFFYGKILTLAINWT